MFLKKGIGRDIAIKLSQCGVNVIAIGRSLNDLDSLKEKTNCKIIQLDLSDWKKTREAVKDIDNVDFLINNAGQTLRKSLLNTSYEDLNRILDINFKACMNLTQIFVRKMVESGKPGSIVNVSSLCGLVGGTFNFEVYTHIIVNNYRSNGSFSLLCFKRCYGCLYSSCSYGVWKVQYKNQQC